jgi:7,8-dihydropterin-6-yl-methyl-4-(beta-D-ribofuranosyl)aminobenzene 5'-phosphate synthase
MKIRILVDNYVSQRSFLAEHGFSVLIEDEGEKILFDTGQGFVLLHNLNLLGLKLTDIDRIILSHGHDDHTGGLNFFVKAVVYPELVAHPDVVYPKYKFANGVKENIGLKVALDGFKNVFKREAFEINKHIIFSGEVPKLKKWELEETQYFRDENGKLERDPFTDDTSLYISLKKGLLVVTGCAHSGIINIIDYGFAITHTDRLYGIIGGMHLKDASEERIEKTVELISQLSPEIVTISHCTGTAAGCLFRSKLGRKVVFTDVGREFTIEGMS